MNQTTKDVLKLQASGVVTDKGFVCGYCNTYHSKFGSKDVTFSNGETRQVCEFCLEKLREVKGVIIHD